MMAERSGFSFPAGFVWGAATAAYQIEGAVQDDGRGEAIWDRFAHTPHKTHNGETGDVACDSYHRYPEDVALLKALNLNAYRFSIAWPRIVPDGGTAVNQRGIDFYNRLVDGLLESGIAPYATLYHWDLPQPLEDAGGWLNRATADRFAYYAETIARALGDRVKHWITLNEPWCSAFLGYGMGIHAPGRYEGPEAALAVTHVLYLGHGKAVAALRAAVPDGQIGITINPVQAEPASDSPADQEAAHRADGAQTRWYLDPLFLGHYPADMVKLYGAIVPKIEPGDMEIIAAPLDFLGVNFYNRIVIADAAQPDNGPLHYTVVHPPNSEYTSMGWEISPASFTRLLTRIARDYKPKAIYVTENGAAFVDTLDSNDAIHDPRRVAYFQSHLNATAQAVAEGAPIRGYFAWSLLDNFEWAFGYSQRFGICYVDYADHQRRIPKDSGRFLAEAALHNVVPTA